MNDEEMDISKELENLHFDSPFSSDDGDEYIQEEDDDIGVIQESKAKKKKKKKEKKRKREYKDDKLELIMDSIEVKDIGDDEGFVDDDYFLISKKKGRKNKKKDLFDIKKAKKDKRKNIEAKFNPELAALRKVLKDTDQAHADINEILAGIRESKSRYVGKTLTDLLQALNTANSTRASVIRDMANIKKTVVDLCLKQEKDKKGKGEDSVDSEEYGVRTLQDIFKAGSRKDLLNYSRTHFEEQHAAAQKSQDYYEDDADDEYVDDYIEGRLNSEADYRSEHGNKYIEYESYHPTDVVVLHPDGTYDMDAVDKNGDAMPDDYPRLDAEGLGDLHFNMDDKIASDRLGRRFKIIESQY